MSVRVPRPYSIALGIALAIASSAAVRAGAAQIPTADDAASAQLDDKLPLPEGVDERYVDRLSAVSADAFQLAREAVAAEIDRHITEPGQGLAYTMGNLEITRLRAHAEQTLGPKFDLREFHDVVLRNGPLPLSILRTQIHDWLDDSPEEPDR